VTVDGQTAEDGTVTVRDRDTLLQDRIAAERVGAIIEERLSVGGVAGVAGVA
jgi:glycyl-tRNA synthetase